jgi:hypothetical protein
MTNQVIGAGTVAIVKALQTDLGLPATIIIHDVTVRLINLRLVNLNTDTRVIRGFVIDANAKPFSREFVQSYSQGQRVSRLLRNHRSMRQSHICPRRENSYSALTSEV